MRATLTVLVITAALAVWVWNQGSEPLLEVGFIVSQNDRVEDVLEDRSKERLNLELPGVEFVGVQLKSTAYNRDFSKEVVAIVTYTRP